MNNTIELCFGDRKNEQVLDKILGFEETKEEIEMRVAKMKKSLMLGNKKIMELFSNHFKRVKVAIKNDKIARAEKLLQELSGDEFAEICLVKKVDGTGYIEIISKAENIKMLKREDVEMNCYDDLLKSERQYNKAKKVLLEIIKEKLQ